MITTMLGNFTFDTNFSNHPDFLADWENYSQNNLPPAFSTPLYIQQYVNGKNLACPMPLLKLKMALKTTQFGNWVYLTATDPNSTQDIGAFCRHLGYEFASLMTGKDTKTFHILVQKTV